MMEIDSRSAPPPRGSSRSVCAAFIPVILGDFALMLVDEI